jgi:hypothetical protein
VYTFTCFKTAQVRGIVFCSLILHAGCDPLSFASLFQSQAEGTSVLTLLDTRGRDLELGDEVQGALSASDYIGLNESYLEAWELEGETGETFSIDLLSDDFDSRLYVVGPGLSETLSDDDGGGACHARITFTVLEPGVFHVVASSTGWRQTGTYRLRVSSTPGPRVAISCGGIDGFALTELPTDGRELSWEAPSNGRLSGAEASIENGRPVQAWTLEGVEGQSATIRLESSDYDAYLYLFGPGLTETLTDDDGGSGRNSALTITFPQTGTYTVGAGALSAGAVGAYTLTVTEPVQLSTLPPEERLLTLGSLQHGTLTAADPIADGRPVQVWGFEARAGQLATIDLMSTDFDSYLQVLGPGLQGTLTDDDGGEGLDSRLQISFSADGT